MTTTAARLGPAELRELFLFADLDDEQLAWVADHGAVVRHPPQLLVVEVGEEEQLAQLGRGQPGRARRHVCSRYR